MHTKWNIVETNLYLVQCHLLHLWYTYQLYQSIYILIRKNELLVQPIRFWNICTTIQCYFKQKSEDAWFLIGFLLTFKISSARDTGSSRDAAASENDSHPNRVAHFFYKFNISWFRLMSNVGQDVEHIWSCLQIRRCGSFPLVWSEFGAGEEEAQFGFTGVQRALQAAPAKKHEYISDQTLMTFWIKANIL